MQRYFASLINGSVNLSAEDIHHITHVMRMRVGDQFEVVDDKVTYLVEITSINPLATKVVEQRVEDVEINAHITLFFALAKGDKIDLVIQKATELGVHRIVLFKSSRCVVNFDNKDLSKKIVRFNKIAKEASEQCHRLIVPEIDIIQNLNEIDKYMEEVNLIAYEKVAGATTNSFNFNKDVKGVSIMIGSEGGFDVEEVDYVLNKGFEVVSLGKRILRCETAAIYALSILAYKLER